MSVLQAVREKCLDCMCGNAAEVRRCPSEDCSLFPYRFGTDPTKKKREYSDEYKEVLRERMKKLAESRKKVEGV